MSDAKCRRVFLKTGAAIATGVALGAFTAAGLAGEPKEKAARAFLDRYDKRIGGAELGKLLVGHTMMGVTYKGREFLAYFSEDGTVTKLIDDRRESGRWEISDGKLQMQFPTLAQGDRFAMEVWRYKDSVLYKGWSAGQERWAWFVLEPGKAKELVYAATGT